MTEPRFNIGDSAFCSYHVKPGIGIVLSIDKIRREHIFSHNSDGICPSRGGLKYNEIHPDGKCWWYHVKIHNQIILIPETCMNTEEEETKAIKRIFFNMDV